MNRLRFLQKAVHCITECGEVLESSEQAGLADILEDCLLVMAEVERAEFDRIKCVAA